MSTNISNRTEQALVGALEAQVRGDVLDRAHPSYDDARRVWNGLIDRHPAAIVRCASTADVVAAVRIAGEHRPPLSIRGGGHQVAGSAVCDDGLVIDVGGMTGIDVDPEARTARVQAGATWADLDRETQRFGLMAPGGQVAATGIAGLTLGGGMGSTMRAFGLSCDNLRSIEVVTADGAVRTASRTEHPDLFWAARGGGRGLGVVTEFEFDLHPLGPEVTSVEVLYPYDQAGSVLRNWRDVAREAPDQLTPVIGLWSIPPLPDVPEELHGAPMVVVADLYAGPPEDAEEAIAPLRRLGTPMADHTATVHYVEAQSSLDPMFPDGGRYYWKSHFLDDVTDDLIDTLVERDAARPSPQSLVVIRTLGGAIARVPQEESAYAHRGAAFNLSVDASWADPALDDTAIAWARGTWDAARPHATGGVYVNFAGFGDESDDVRGSVLGASEERVDRIRAGYDPDGLFAGAALRP